MLVNAAASSSSPAAMCRRKMRNRLQKQESSTKMNVSLFRFSSRSCVNFRHLAENYHPFWGGVE
jgi:hypothetical protein